MSLPFSLLSLAQFCGNKSPVLYTPQLQPADIQVLRKKVAPATHNAYVPDLFTSLKLDGTKQLHLPTAIE
jgi:hypothetical protein